MKVALLLFPAVMLFSGTVLAQEDEQVAPSSHPTPQNPENTLPEPKRTDAPILSAYGRANQLKYLIEPDICLGFAHGQVNIGIGPTVGHKIWKGMYAGAGVTFIYSGTQNLPLADINGQVYYANAHNYTYGAGVYIHYNIWKGLYARARFDILHRQIENLEGASYSSNPQTGGYTMHIPVVRMNVPDLPLSIGYNLLAKKNLFLPIALSYNILYPILNKQYTLYPNGWVLQVCVVNIF